MSNHINAPWQNDHGPNEDEVPGVILEYKTPGQRTKLTIEKTTLIAAGVALLGGLLEIVQAYASGTVADTNKLLTMVTTLILMVGMTALKKYADASDQEGT